MRPDRAAAVMLVILAAAAPALAQGLELSSSGAAPLPTAYLDERIAALEQEVRSAQRGRAQQPHEQAIAAASVHVRRIAIALLELARKDTTPRSSGAALWGFTLANHGREFDALFRHLDSWARDARRNPDDVQALRRLNRGMELLQAFAGMPIDGAHAPPADPDALRQWLQNRMSILLVLAEMTGEPRPRGAWTVLQSRRLPVTAARLSALVNRTQQLTVAPEARLRITQLAQRLREAVRFDPEFGPQVVELYGVLIRCVDLLAAVEAIDAPEAGPLRDLLDQRMTALLEAAESAATRPTAMAELNRLVTIAPLLDQLGVLEPGNGGRPAALRLTITAAERSLDPSTAGQGADALVWLEEFLSLTRQMHGLPESTGALDFRKADSALRSALSSSHRQAVASLTRLADDLSLAVQPEFTLRLASLRTGLDRLRAMRDVGACLEDARLIDAALALSVSRRLTAAAVRVSSGDLGAAAEIVAFTAQSRRFSPVAGETEVRNRVMQSEPAWPAVLGSRASEVLDGIARQRRIWLDRWAQGQSASDAEAAMDAIETWMRLAQGVAHLQAAPAGPATLCRWPGLEVDPLLLNALVRQFAGRLSPGADMIIAGRIGELRRIVDTIQAEQPTSLLLVDIWARVNAAVEQRPPGVVGVLSEMLYGPEPGALSPDAAADLAQLSRTLNEFLHPRVHNDAASQAALRNACATLSRRIRDQMRAGDALGPP